MPPKKRSVAPKEVVRSSPRTDGGTTVVVSRPVVSHKERVMTLLGASPSSYASNTSSVTAGGSLGSSHTFRSPAECAAMLRAVYVVTQTDKAQLKLRPQELSNVPPVQKSLAATAASSSGNTAVVMASPSKVQPAGLHDFRITPGTASMRPPLPTPPPSPSRFFSPQPSRRAESEERGFVRGRSEGSTSTPAAAVQPLNLAVFADQRWRNAVSMMVGETVTIDHVARLAKLFPSHLRVAWSLPSMLLDASQRATTARATSTRIDEVLRQLSEEEQHTFRPLQRGEAWRTNLYPTEARFGSSSSENREDSALSLGRLRVTLLKTDIPSMEALQSEIVERGGEAWLRSVDHDTAWSLLSAANSAINTSAGVISLSQRHLDYSFPSNAEEQQLQRSKRQRESSCDNASACEPCDNAVGDAAHNIPDHLMAVLSAAKRQHVIHAAATEQRSVATGEAERLDHRVAWEKLLGLYDLIRICFGAPHQEHSTSSVLCYRQLGGTNLVELLVAQNRYGCTKEEVVRHLKRLLSFADSGLRVSPLQLFVQCPAPLAAATTTGVHVSDTPTATSSFSVPNSSEPDAFDAVLFHLSPNACRANLEVALEQALANGIIDEF